MNMDEQVELPPLEGLAVFVAICQGGSLSRAAELTGLSRPTVARRLDALEGALGVRLAHRTTRTFTLTAAGEALFPRARRVLDEARAATRAVADLDGTPRGLLRVSLPGELPVLDHLLLDFMERWPEVQLEVVISTRFVDLVAEGYDVALRADPRQGDDRLVARRLLPIARRAYASPAYLAEHGTPETPAELSEHACIRTFERGQLPQTHWPLLGGGQVPVSGPVASNGLGLVERSVSRGFGIGLLPGPPEGAVPVLPDEVGSDGSLSVVYPERALLPARVRAFVDHLVEHVRPETFYRPS